MRNIYKVERSSEPGSYDYTAFICYASSYDEASKMHPEGGTIQQYKKDHPNEADKLFDWDEKDVECTYLGTNDSVFESSVILTQSAGDC